MAMTNRFVKISAGPERLEIRRYEDADGGINLERIHEYWVERMDQAAGRTRPTREGYPLVRIMNRAVVPVSQASQPGLVMTGGQSHSSMYGFQKDGPLPREATV